MRVFVANRKNLEAASNMILGSTYAGLAFAHARVGNVHAMSHPLGGLFHIMHGVACGAVLPTVLEYNALADTGRYEQIYKKFKGPAVKCENFHPMMLVEDIRQLLIDLNMPTNLSVLGIKESDIPALTEGTMTSTTLYTINPRQTGAKEFAEIYRKAL